MASVSLEGVGGGGGALSLLQAGWGAHAPLLPPLMCMGVRVSYDNSLGAYGIAK